MSEPTRRLSNIQWHATGVDGHTYHTCGEWQYTSDAPPVEAEEYERMKQRAEAAEAKLAMVDEYGESQWHSGASGTEFEAGLSETFAEWLAQREEYLRA